LFPYKVGQRLLHLQSFKSPINHAPEADLDYMPILLLMRNPLVPAVYLKNEGKIFVLDGLPENGMKVPAVDDFVLHETLLADLGNNLRETWKALPLLSTVIFKRRFSQQKMSS
jgi:hypothetical protein